MSRSVRDTVGEMRRYRVHAYLLAAAALCYGASLATDPDPSSVLLVLAGALVVGSGVLGLLVGRNVVIRLLVDFFEVDPTSNAPRPRIHRRLAKRHQRRLPVARPVVDGDGRVVVAHLDPEDVAQEVPKISLVASRSRCVQLCSGADRRATPRVLSVH